MPSLFETVEEERPILKCDLIRYVVLFLATKNEIRSQVHIDELKECSLFSIKDSYLELFFHVLVSA